MFLTSLAALLAGAVAIQAIVVPRQDCLVYGSGYLSANVNGVLKSFTTATNGKVIYTGSGKKPIQVEFQACFLGDATDGIRVGRLYVPSSGKCVSVTNQASPKAPYFSKVTKCASYGPSYAETWVYRDGSIYWAGKTDEEGVDLQGGCGLFGYKSHAKGIPSTLSSTRQIQLTCYGKSTPFYLSSTVH